MSVKAPALILGEETSRTPPSKVLSRLKALRKDTWAVVVVMLIDGDTRKPSATQVGSLWKAAFGAEGGVLVIEVVQLLPRAQVPVGVQLAAPLVKEVVHPAGK